jgi:hypothetical protein
MVTHLIVEALGDVNSSSIREGLDDIKDVVPTLSPHVACNSSRVGELSVKFSIAIIVVLVLGIIIIIYFAALGLIRDSTYVCPKYSGLTP